MKILTKEEEAAHYNATLQGGAIGLVTGSAIGLAGVYAASARYHFFRQLTLPLKAFLVTSAGTFAGIVAADSSSRRFEQDRNPVDREYKEREREQYQAQYGSMSWTERSMAWGSEHRYQIVGGSWVASMVTAFALVNRNKFLTGAQKLVQARVYAQFLTLGVLVASAAFEIADSRNQEGKYEEIRYVDPTDPEHKRILTKKEPVGSHGGGSDDGDSMWKDMVKAEEQRIKDREADESRFKKRHEKLNESKSKAGTDRKEKNGDSKSSKPEKSEAVSSKREKNQEGKDSTPDQAPEQSEDETKKEQEKTAKEKKGREEQNEEKDTDEMSDEEELIRAKEGKSGYGAEKNQSKKDVAQDAPKGSSSSKGKVPSANDAKEKSGEKSKDGKK